MQLGLARVVGASMEPTYLDGDLLLVLHGGATRVGAPHLLRLPDGPDGARPLAIKRVTRAGTASADGDRTWWVERDNPRIGVDSWLVGDIPEQDIVARVLCRLLPARRIFLRRRRT